MKFKISAKEIEAVLKTLPIGYYTGRRLQVVFDHTDETYVNMMTDTIHIGELTVQKGLNNLDTSKISPSKVEEYVRCALYHEVSHVLLTPFSDTYSDSAATYWGNVFEDERIETLLSRYYMNVNFKEFVFKVNGWTKDKKPSNGAQFYYYIVRYRIGPKYLVNQVGDIIRDFSSINCTSKMSKYYWDRVYKFYMECLKEWENQENQKAESKANNSKDENEGGEQNNKSSKSSSQKGNGDKDKQEQKSQQSGDDPSNEEKGWDGDNDSQSGSKENSGEEEREAGKPSNNASENDEDQQTQANSGDGEALNKAIEEATKKQQANALSDPGEVKTILNKLLKSMIDPNLEAAFKRFIIRNNNRKAMRTSSSQGYSGHINIKSTITRPDYRWFKRKGTNGGHEYASTHITLWVDCSGSFYYSIDKINSLIFTLNSIERKMGDEFSFDVVKMNDTNKIADKSIQLEANGGNCFGDGIDNEMLKKLNKPGCQNYNIAVWDGDMFSLGKYYAGETILSKIFNNPKSVIVTDYDNASIIQENCPKSRNIIINGGKEYAEKFIDEVVRLCGYIFG